MEALQAILQTLPLTLITVTIKYRFPGKVLGLRYRALPTFLIMLAAHIVSGWMNLHFHLAGDIVDNLLYYGLMTIALYLLLFKGNLVKKVFLTILIDCGFSILFYLFLPFVHCFLYQNTDAFLLTLDILEFVNLLLCAVGIEIVGRKFQNLRRELPVDYTIYLTAVILFVYVAVYAAYDRMVIINEGMISLPAAIGTAAFAASGLVIVVVAIFAVDRQVHISLKEQLHTVQAESFKSRELEWRKFAGFRHDIKNHLICLSKLLENGKVEQALSYMGNLTDTMKQFDDPVRTGNDYADALLSVKYAEAVAAKIAVSIEMAIPPQGYLDPVDLCCILSNAFDNAIAACNRLTSGEKWITAHAFIKQGQLVIVIKNSKPPHVTVINGEVSPKEITTDHGLGLDTVKAVVQKYGGVLHLSAADNFSFSVLLPPLRL